jgi:hypothetical protein
MYMIKSINNLNQERFDSLCFRSSGGHTYVVNTDSAFTLSYAVIMLNVDQVIMKTNCVKEKPQILI